MQPETGTDGLVEFLRARLDEDEADAKRAVPGPWAMVGEPRDTTVFSMPAGISVAHGWLRDLAHIARHDPARVLAEVAAKRRILDELDAMPHALDDGHHECPMVEPTAWKDPRCTCGQAELADRVLRLLALPYAGRPGYREEWQPA